MKIKFQDYNELYLWFSRNNILISKTYSENCYYLFDIKLNNKDEFYEWLENNQLIEIIYKPNISLTLGSVPMFKEYYYEVEYIILNESYLKSIQSNKFINQEININRLLSLNEVCQYLSLTKPSIYKLFNEGLLNYYTILSQRKVKLKDLMEYINTTKSK